jgi:hypothetical protein
VAEAIRTEFALCNTLTIDTVRLSVIERLAATVRALVRAEVEAQPLTVAEHVAALVGMGCTKYDKVEAFLLKTEKEKWTFPLTAPSIIILPPEAP